MGPGASSPLAPGPLPLPLRSADGAAVLSGEVDPEKLVAGAAPTRAVIDAEQLAVSAVDDAVADAGALGSS